jgi:hypothetical protein
MLLASVFCSGVPLELWLGRLHLVNKKEWGKSADEPTRIIMEDKKESVFDNPGVWAFVLNPQTVIEATLPFELAPNSFIDVASSEQRERIKNELSKLVGNRIFAGPEDYYESTVVTETDAQGGMRWHYEPLPPTEWRYYIVTTPDNGNTNHNLHLAASISSTPLDIAGLLFFKAGGVGSRFYSLKNYFNDITLHPIVRINEASLNEISLIYRSYMDLTNGGIGEVKFPEIQRAVTMFDSLSALPPNSEFAVLGLFAIIEMLITHNPKLEDRGDTITHQMKSKIPLLSHRFDRPLDYSFFQDTNEEKIWSALYKYRSALAHGGAPDFCSKELRVLKDSKTATIFLKEVVKALLRHSLNEPQLLRDLRNC